MKKLSNNKAELKEKALLIKESVYMFRWPWIFLVQSREKPVIIKKLTGSK